MIVYDFVNEPPVTSHASIQILSIVPLKSDSKNAYETLNENNAVSHLVIAEPTVPNSLNVDETVGTQLEASDILFEVNAGNHDAGETNEAECALGLES